jgi:hypothetical protein
MIRSLAFVAAVATVPAAFPEIKSDQTGVYGLVDAVKFHGGAEQPTAVELRGVFAVAAGLLGDEYLPAAAGRLVFTIEPGKENQTLDQWRDLERLAGTGKVVAFGSRYAQSGVRVEPFGDVEVQGTEFRVHMGVHAVENADYAPIRQLRYVPEPVTPAHGSELGARGGDRPGMRVLLSARNCRATEPGLRYLFEVTLPSGATLASRPIAQTANETSWDVVLPLQPGDTITWRVRVLDADLDVVPVATSTFRVVESQK